MHRDPQYVDESAPGLWCGRFVALDLVGRLATVAAPLGGGATPVPGSGMGLPGMRDRVAAAGGTLDIDPGPPRFVVRATLPTEEAP